MTTPDDLRQIMGVTDAALDAIRQMTPALRERIATLRGYADALDRLAADLERQAGGPPAPQIEN